MTPAKARLRRRGRNIWLCHFSKAGYDNHDTADEGNVGHSENKTRWGYKAQQGIAVGANSKIYIGAFLQLSSISNFPGKQQRFCRCVPADASLLHHGCPHRSHI